MKRKVSNTDRKGEKILQGILGMLWHKNRHSPFCLSCVGCTQNSFFYYIRRRRLETKTLILERFHFFSASDEQASRLCETHEHVSTLKSQRKLTYIFLAPAS